MSIPMAQLMQAERMHMSRQVLALRALYPNEHYSVHSTPYHRDSSTGLNVDARDNTYDIPTNTGVLTIQSPKRFIRKINHSVGFGMANIDFNDSNDGNNNTVAESISWPAILADVEAVYRANSGAPPDFDVVDSVAPEALAALQSAGYRSTYEVATHARRMQDLISLLEGDDRATGNSGQTESTEVATEAGSVMTVIIEQFDQGKEGVVEEFVRASVSGFRSGGREEELLRLLAESAASREDTVLFRAMVEGQLVGTGGMAILEVDGGQKFAHLYIDSTLDAARGKGVHRALLLARMRAARDAGCDVVIASAGENTGSARNLERVGLEKALVYGNFRRQENLP